MAIQFAKVKTEIKPASGTAFDYGLLGLHAEEVRRAANRIKGNVRLTAERIIEIGRDLLAVKRLVGHGHWLAWLALECQFSDKTARNFMNVAENIGQIRNVGVIPLGALYELAGPSTPGPIRRQIMAEIEQGARPTKSEIKAIVKRRGPGRRNGPRPVIVLLPRELAADLEAWCARTGMDRQMVICEAVRLMIGPQSPNAALGDVDVVVNMEWVRP